MVSKKVIASTLAGTKALGVSGALGWALGLFDGEGLENVMDGEIDDVEPELVSEPEPKLDQEENVPSGPEDRAEPEKQTAREVKNSQAGTDAGKGIQLGGGSSIKGVVESTWSKYFADEGEATEYDRKAVKESSTWKVEIKEIMQLIMVKAEGDSWNCGLKPVVIDWFSSSKKEDYLEFKLQAEKLIDAIKDNDAYKKQFVANCSRTRRDLEKTSGNTSEIELETEMVSYNKYKFKEKDKYFERLWTGDFRGVDRLSENDGELLNVSSAGLWSIKEESGTKGKIKISSRDNKFVCYISGTPTKGLENKTFKDEDDKLKDILGFSLSSSEIEKKKYIIRNCRKNGMNIEGLKIKNVGRNQWGFEEASLKKISEGMHENPSEVKS